MISQNAVRDSFQITLEAAHDVSIFLLGERMECFGLHVAVRCDGQRGFCERYVIGCSEMRTMSYRLVTM